jgi:hypothetical protein
MITLEDIKHEVRALTVEQRKQLIAYIVDSLTEHESNEKTRSILEFEGIAAHLANGEDPQDYVNRLRSEWDDRP